MRDVVLLLILGIAIGVGLSLISAAIGSRFAARHLGIKLAAAAITASNPPADSRSADRSL